MICNAAHDTSDQMTVIIAPFLSELSCSWPALYMTCSWHTLLTERDSFKYLQEAEHFSHWHAEHGGTVPVIYSAEAEQCCDNLSARGGMPCRP